MSNNLVSQPLSVPNNQMGQMEPITSKWGSSVHDIQMVPVGHLMSSPLPQQLTSSNNQMSSVELTSSIPGTQKLPISNKHVGHVETSSTFMTPQQFSAPNRQAAVIQQLLASNKRKVPAASIPDNLMHQQFSVSNKSFAAGLQHPPSKRPSQMLPMSGIVGSQNFQVINKKMMQMQSATKKATSQQSLTPRSRPVQSEQSPKPQSESFQSVRLKLRESLASALALVSQQQEKSPNSEKSTQTEGETASSKTEGTSQPSESCKTAADATESVSETKDSLPSKECSSAQELISDASAGQRISTDKTSGDSLQNWKPNAQEIQPNPALPEEDVSFGDNPFVKDELLQGNGLSWAFDLDVVMDEPKEVELAKESEFDGDGRKLAASSPEDVAQKIEAELFKKFGGVNKKYKEKGRSLLFNLKDRNNPELRERVMAGEITPEKLCSMTAEELASKELSEWRMAKAEELAQMVVLPDADVDIRRLVRKTHKGEFQVEVEQDDSMSVEVSVGASSLTQVHPRVGESDTVLSSVTKTESSVASDKNDSRDQELPKLTILPNDGTDPMQGLVVDDIKDTESLPPIVSLDEFMESLNAEPPFENLEVGNESTEPTVDGERAMPVAGEESSDVVSELKSSDIASNDTNDSNLDESDKANVKDTKFNAGLKSGGKEVQIEVSPPRRTSGGEHVWEGYLQLNISSMATVIGSFKSGEKTSTKEWPSDLEIKGRVRLDAFEKFLQDLPMSRSRAIMLLQFVWKEGSSKSEYASLCEVADSYVADERLGFAEPASGVEIYFCPPHAKTLDMLSRHLSKDYTEKLSASDKGLIGVVVWRRTHLTSTMSPNSSSHHKHGTRRLHSTTSKRQQERDTNLNANFTSKAYIPPTPSRPNNPMPPDDDDDDVPPGFGPPASRDDDDLPEFNFSGSSNPPQFSTPRSSQEATRINLHPVPSRPADQMRELVQKYGQTGTSAVLSNWQNPRDGGSSMNTWNEDDDDDIPEWQPQAPQLQPPPLQPSVRSLQIPGLPPHMLNQTQPQQQLLPLAAPLAMHLQPKIPTNAAQGAWWPPTQPSPRGHQLNNLEHQSSGGHYHGAPGRGF
ncbi:Spen-like protein SPOC, C-terminal [Dillenia turbinata]|uniref:Spen-like protein SPOC, C-terminal n=1 Tax=Dillenia turbinata TaxID=194707 RepID=A0AAN8V2V7_9MAGN